MRFEIDHDLHMVKEKAKETSIDHLRFLRFKAERGDFGPKPLSVPRGENIFRLSIGEINHYAMQQADITPDEKLRQHLSAQGDY